ncbi:MAG: efflux RND transporter permease subunit [Planctomycetaceae bacterium]
MEKSSGIRSFSATGENRSCCDHCCLDYDHQFLPVFMLTGRDHRLFSPLAWTKSFSLFASLMVAVTVVPFLCRSLCDQFTRILKRFLLSLLCGVGLSILILWIWWGHLANWSSTQRLLLIIGGVLASSLLTFWALNEKLRPMDAEPRLV